ncbi:hypothetical protein TD95_005321 [Thielaviopsis punctulata]|uniref:Glucose N-acetyltransferase 1 n=1 Tax=Thielaviopsis punctulata TaxID=72032 RepID=A0A0F4ZHR7_9PEZI|nr:hypothetical protein TD95_005321 [Thielaviopsis punctulata]
MNSLLRSLVARPSRWIPLCLCLLLLSLSFVYTPFALPSVQVTFPTTTAPNPLVVDPSPPPSAEIPPAPLTADWSRFAYAQYVTNTAYLCNSVMFFEALQRHDSKAQRVMMYPRTMMAPDATDANGNYDAGLLIKARDEYGVKLSPIDVQHKVTSDTTWADSYTKLLVFNQTQYARVLSVDSDSLLMHHMDELFFTPAAPIAMPRAYWLYPKQKVLSSQLMLVTPSAAEFQRVQRAIQQVANNEYDMEIVNTLYGDSAVVLPHRAYDMLSAEFRATDHAKYLGSADEKWDPVAAYNEAKMVHFSDWPVPKPWRLVSPEMRNKHGPKCDGSGGRAECAEWKLWNSLYDDFAAKRKEVCG